MANSDSIVCYGRKPRSAIHREGMDSAVDVGSII